jgi:Domain of unknown function (DUF4465)/PEP-CTERM motif
MKHALTLAAFLLLASQTSAQTTTINFEDKSLPPDSFYNGSDLAGGFTSGGAFFNNSYSPAFGAWSGWSYSNIKDVTTAGFGNQYAAYALPGGGGVGGAGNFGVAFNFSPGDARITLPAGSLPLSVSITNTTYAALSMKNGDSFAKKFGGGTGNDPDFFLLTIQGRDSSDSITGTVPFYLADYRFTDNTLDYIVSTWQSVDLSTLPGTTKSLTFDLTSSDNGEFGMNTPSYFALDSLLVTAVPEPSTLALLSITAVGGPILGWKRFRRNRRNLKLTKC